MQPRTARSAGGASELRRFGRVGVCLAGIALGTVGLVACGSDGGSSKSFCAALRSAPTLESVVSGFTGLDAPELSRRLDRAASAYDTVESTAPDEIDDDVEVVVTVVNDVIESIRANPGDPTAAMNSVRRTIKDQKDLKGATARVSSYAKSECDLDLNPGATVPTTTTTP
ncbi:MAG: hypothetical protein KDB02_15055 [Acidimicrobiales bacterium]|nr:hypothetical protein [Acidimicrobiales bacterium]